MLNQKRTVSSNSEALKILFGRFTDGLRLAIPLGVGKPNRFVNDFYGECKKRPGFQVSLYTGLSLDVPVYKTSIEKNLIQPTFDELLGKDYPYLQYVRDQNSGKVPANVGIFEFYFQPGAQLGHPASQQDYTSVNYTHVVPQLVDLGVQCVFQAIARHRTSGHYSLSTNPDLTTDLRSRFKELGRPLFLVGVVNSEMPYTTGDAEVDLEFFDMIVESPENNHAVFSLPHQPVDNVDLAVGLNASQLLADDGTLQIGIGSLTESLAASLIFRQKQNAEYVRAVSDAHIPAGLKNVGLFDKGVFGTSELITDGFMHLARAGIVKRAVNVKRLGRSLTMEGAFLLGSAAFYDWVRETAGEATSLLAMTPVSHINDLYEEDEAELRRERKNARFFNSCMGASLLGEVFSETLADGRVISGVGGQYNFVAMAHELRDARSILMFRSERLDKGIAKSNINMNGHFATIPRHLRDLFVNEYGVADTRYVSDSQVIESLLQITDLKFQDELIVSAQKSGKLDQSFRPSLKMKTNTFSAIDKKIEGLKAAGFLNEYPFGTEFKPVQVRLIRALTKLKALGRAQLAGALIQSLMSSVSYDEEVHFLKLESGSGFKQRLARQVVRAAMLLVV